MNKELFQNKYRVESTRLKNWDYSSSGVYFITINTKNSKHYFGKIKNGIMIKNKLGEITEKYWKEIPKHYKNTILDEYIIMPNHIHGIIIIPCKDDGTDLYNPIVSHLKHSKDDGKFQSPLSTKCFSRNQQSCTASSQGINTASSQGINTASSQGISTASSQGINTASSQRTQKEHSSKNKKLLEGISLDNSLEDSFSDKSSLEVNLLEDRFNNEESCGIIDYKRGKAVPCLYGRNGAISSVIGSFKSICTREINKVFDIGFLWHSGYYDRIVRNQREFDNVRNYIINNPKKFKKG